MSLILDALKKSEQERRRDKGPDLQTIHQPVVVRAPRRSYAVIWGALLLSVNAAALAYWWQQRATPVVAGGTAPAPAPLVAAAPAAATPAVAPAPAPAAVPAAAPVATPVPAPAVAVADTAEYTHITPGGNPAAADAAGVENLRIEEVDELPEDVRNNLPAMTFSFHVFSSTPQQRTIIINNRRMREGDEVSAGLVLQQITEDGVVLLFERHRIHISVLSGW
jgi:general secretion pathway protein B